MSCTLTIRNLALKRGEITIAQNINLSVRHKEKIAVIGHNGSGKTTLLETIVGLNPFDRGEIELFHEKLTDKNDFANARKDIGYLLQDSDDHFLLPIARDDIAFSLLSCGENAEIAAEKTEKIMRDLNIAKLADKIVYNLSGGEKKLVALAGILVRDPKLLLLDEPTSTLDYAAQIALARILRDLRVSMVIVSHDRLFLEEIASDFYMIDKNGLKKIADFESFITHSHDNLPTHTHPKNPPAI
ncbi:MAG: energy-coupling factor ABC transporter ATP-binding protein [Helicobacteraceae bacterium]|jgi:cobalt/nickel transport system ATP-binding protein|nr:energy-coupling factor ABC transporter ATP-binding protein [Helicobacteraceae bacterium]